MLTVFPWALVAQSAHPGANARWIDPWSPLASRADLASRLPNALNVSIAPLQESPPFGVFWTVGNPAGLRGEINESRSNYGLTMRRESGALRRPLDPASTSSWHGEASGWSVPSKRLALLGRATSDRRMLEGSRANILQPYSSGPFVTLDTSASDLERTTARVEGVVGLGLGSWNSGLALGYDGANQQSIESGLVRRVRQSTTGIALGALRRVGVVAIAPYFRWRGRAETTSLFERDAEGIAVELETLSRSRELDILTAYYRRSTENVLTAGSGLEVAKGSSKWLVYGERSALRLALTSQQTNTPASDIWKSKEWSGGIGYRARIDSASQAQILLRYAGLAGEGDLARDSVGSIVGSKESTYSAYADVRRSWLESGWTGSLTLQVELERRDHRDLTVPMTATITGLTSSAALQIGKRKGRLFGHALVAIAHYSSTGAFPNPNTLTTSYRKYVVNQYDLLGRPMLPLSIGAGARCQTGRGSWLWTRIGVDAVSASRGATAFAPVGTRYAVSAAAGITSIAGR